MSIDPCRCDTRCRQTVDNTTTASSFPNRLCNGRRMTSRTPRKTNEMLMEKATATRRIASRVMSLTTLLVLTSRAKDMFHVGTVRNGSQRAMPARWTKHHEPALTSNAASTRHSTAPLPISRARHVLFVSSSSPGQVHSESNHHVYEVAVRSIKCDKRHSTSYFKSKPSDAST